MSNLIDPEVELRAQFDFEESFTKLDAEFDREMAKAVKKKLPEVCSHWLNSICHKTELECPRWHKYDLKLLPLCRFYKEGKCNNPDCRFRHPTDEEEDIICIAYAQGFCKRGKNCPEHHIKRTARDIINQPEYVKAAVESKRRAQMRANQSCGILPTMQQIPESRFKRKRRNETTV